MLECDVIGSTCPAYAPYRICVQGRHADLQANLLRVIGRFKARRGEVTCAHMDKEKKKDDVMYAADDVNESRDRKNNSKDGDRRDSAISQTTRVSFHIACYAYDCIFI